MLDPPQTCGRRDVYGLRQLAVGLRRINLQGIQDATIDFIEGNIVLAHDFDELENISSINEIIFHREIVMKYSVKNIRI
jgi:hypothetical protein